MGKTRAAEAHPIQHQPCTAEDCHLNAVPSRCALNVPSCYKRLFRGRSRASSCAPVAQHYTHGGTLRTGAPFVRKRRRCRCPKPHLLHTAPSCLQVASTRRSGGLLDSLILRGDGFASVGELERAMHAVCAPPLSAPFTRRQASFQNGCASRARLWMLFNSADTWNCIGERLDEKQSCGFGQEGFGKSSFGILPEGLWHLA